MICDSAVEFLGTNKDVCRSVCSRMFIPSLFMEETVETTAKQRKNALIPENP